MPHEIIDPRKVVVKIAKILHEVGIPYFITGGFAVSVWGRPRATFDIDIVVELAEPKVGPLAQALLKVYHAGYLDEETAKDAVRRKGEFNFIDPFTRVKIDFWITKRDELSLLALRRKLAKKINGRTVYFISPEDLILSKLKWYQIGESTRQLEDIESVLKISGEKLDMKYIKHWAKKIGALGILNKTIKGKS